jgi:surfactin synthase thioesterase subunit
MARAAIRLLCLPCAGASATMYLRWCRQLPEWIELLPLELPGRGSRLGEPFVEDFGALVVQLCHEHESAMQGAYALFGHSMGALLAYGIAQQLQAEGRPLPLALFVSGSPAPSRRDAGRFTRKDDHAGLVADLRSQGGTPEAVFDSPELLRMTLDTLGADYRVCESFVRRPLPPLAMPVHAFGGRHDDIAAERIAAWRHETQGSCSVSWFDGGHFFIRQQEAMVLRAITRELTPPAARSEGASA